MTTSSELSGRVGVSSKKPSDPIDRWPTTATEGAVFALAPMEGVSDVVVRRLLASLGGMDYCVSEFLRVTHHPLSPSTLLRHVPELSSGGRTAHGVPVQVQLLGSDPQMMALSALQAIELGALAIDLNFGCPARRVNGHDGGAALLRSPSRLERVVSAVRNAVPRRIAVSTKIRLGFEDPDDVYDVVRAAENAGTDWITIHGRTKVQMYKPPADWVRIGRATQIVRIPIVANGDIFTRADLEVCERESNCRAVMLGRGAFRQPGLFNHLRDPTTLYPWTFDQRRALLLQFVAKTRLDARFRTPDRAALSRLKQWLREMANVDDISKAVFEDLKRMQRLDDAVSFLS
ncbi:MAG: tRNA-dihydrouridine synthase family protein, partial [Myxococcota bacterium]